MSLAGGETGKLLTAAPSARGAAWLALLSAGLAWLFDAMDFQLFTLILFPSVSELLGSTETGRVAGVGGVIVFCKILAWGIGGIVFGVLADRIGRARTMLVTVLIYALFTGLSSLAQDWRQLAALQALAGLGLGGEWAAGAALVSETWPESSRARAVQVMQLCFGLGFLAAGLVNLVVGPFGWRWVFVVGAVPAPAILLLRVFVREPDRWIAARRVWANDPQRNRPTATLRAIFSPGMRRGTIVGVLVVLFDDVGQQQFPAAQRSLDPHASATPGTGAVRTDHQPIFPPGRPWRHSRLRWPHLAYRASVAALGLHRDRARLCFCLPDDVQNREQHSRPALLRSILRLFHNRRLWVFCRLPRRVVPNRYPWHWARLLLEYGALPGRAGAAACWLPGHRPRLRSGSRAADCLRLLHWTNRDLVRTSQYGPVSKRLMG